MADKVHKETIGKEDVGELSVQSGGVRSRRAFMMKQFIPSADFIAKEVIGKGKGTKVILGRIYGIVTGSEVKTGTLPNGDPSSSIVLKGIFQSEDYLSGEVEDATAVFFPGAFSDKIHGMLAADPDIKTVEIDCDIGLEATGKTIPYSWVIIQHVEGKQLEPMKRLKTSRGRPEGIPQLPARAAPKQLTSA